MPSKKPIIHFNTEQWIIDKMKYIAEENSRSLAKEMEYLCKKRIKTYESEHGEIIIPEEKGLRKEISTLRKYKTGEIKLADMIRESAQNAKKDYWEEK